MKRFMMLLTVFILSIVLVACGDSTEEVEVNSVDSSNNNEVVENNSEEENEENVEEDVEEVGEVVADDDTIKATLDNIEHKKDEMFDEESYRVNFELENKYNGKIVVQARSVSIDWSMVDDMVLFSDDIAEGKKENGKLDIQNFDGDLPELTEDLEMKLGVLDDESFQEISTYDVSINF